jgi:hypothetical protein
VSKCILLPKPTNNEKISIRITPMKIKKIIIILTALMMPTLVLVMLKEQKIFAYTAPSCDAAYQEGVNGARYPEYINCGEDRPWVAYPATHPLIGQSAFRIREATDVDIQYDANGYNYAGKRLTFYIMCPDNVDSDADCYHTFETKMYTWDSTNNKYVFSQHITIFANRQGVCHLGMDSCISGWSKIIASQGTGNWKNFMQPSTSSSTGSGGGSSTSSPGTSTGTAPDDASSTPAGDKSWGGEIPPTETCSSSDPAGCLSDPTTESGRIMAILKKGLTILSGAVVMAAVIMLIMAGVQYSASGGEPSGVAAAKKKIGNVLLGLLAYIFLYAFLQWLIPGGLVIW